MGAACVLAAALALAGSASAQENLAPRGQAGISLFTDDMGTTIWSPHASAGATLPGEVETDVSWVADVISSASVDVVTAATGRMEELRNQVTLAGAREHVANDLDVHGAYTYSVENDAFSHVAQLGARLGIDDDNFEVGAQYGLSYNRLGVASDATRLWGTLWVNNLDVDLVVLFGAKTQVDLVYSGAWNSGYMANPYRRVPIAFRTDLRGAQWVDESVPDTRLRHAITGRIRHAFSSRLLGFLDYRFYVDSWSVVGHTAQLKLALRLGSELTFQVRARGTLQGAASFYQTAYDVPTVYRTRDRRLSSHLSGMVGGAIIWQLGPTMGLEALNLRLAVDGVAWYYDDFLMPVLLPTSEADQGTLGLVQGLVAQVGIEVRP